MVGKKKAVLVAADDGLRKAVAKEAGGIAEFVRLVRDPRQAYRAVKDSSPEFVVIEVDGMPSEAVSLARRLKGSIPGLTIFFVAKNKDPELILAGLRAGVDDYISISDDSGRIASIIQKALDRSETADKRGEVIGIFSPRGGLGVTSITINLTDHIHHITGDRVVVSDMGLFIGDVVIFCDVSCDYTHFHMLRDLDRMDDNLLFSSLVRHPNGFYLLATPDEVTDAEEIRPDDVASIIRLLSFHLEYVLLDLPHDFTEKTLAAIDQCDHLIMLTQQFLPAVKSTQKALDFFNEVGIAEGKTDIVINRYETRNELDADDISYILKQPVFATIANDFHSLSHAINKGKMLRDMYPEKRINRDIQSLASIITGILPEKADVPWWQRIFTLGGL